MALSQIQCLNDNHVNPRTHESKPEFLYCEEQRAALETLLRDGREAFFKHLAERGLRGFLSELELGALAGNVEPYDPGSELYREDTDDEESPLSLHYWPDMSDMSIPQLDLGWPDSEAYRGVTRTTVYTQPPLDGQTHIKEVIRKMIAQAQKVIAVVMDVFTDVDIFRDLLDASFKRKVSVYILLERNSIPNFLSMCQRANMHTGHLKNLRVRSLEGTEFYTHSCTKVRGHMGHRLMFVDGDKAVSGSYNFTWMSSRLNLNLITVVTGQAVDAFDRLFRLLFTTSKQVDLHRVATEPEPEPDPVPQTASVALPSAAVARKLYNPKYALVAAAGNASLSPSSSAGNNSPKESPKGTKNEDTNKKGRRRTSKGVIQEAPPLHPGLVGLEKAYLFDYLPTWPEPDPPSDVIGFINIRDSSRPTQVHLQRSEMFEVSQAIRFSSPFTMQKESLPEVAKPRNLTATKHEENPPQQNRAEQKTQLEPITVKTTELPQSESDKENAPNKESNLQSNTTTTNKNALHSSTTNLHTQTPEQSVKTVTPPTVTAGSPTTTTEAGSQTSLNSKGVLKNNGNGTESNQSSKLFPSSDSNSPKQKQNLSENLPSSAGNFISAATATTTSSANYKESVATAVHSGLTSASPISTLTTISTSTSPLNTTSITTSSSQSPPVPKPRTVQLVIKDPSPSNGQKIPEVSMVKKPNSTAKTKLTTNHNEPLVATVLPLKEPEIVPELANKSTSKSIPAKSTEDTGKVCLQEKESRASQVERSEEAAGPRSDKADTQMDASNKVAQTKANDVYSTKETTKNIQMVTEKEDEEAKTKNNKAGLIIKTTESPLKSSGIAKVRSPTSNKVGRPYQARAFIPQKISYSNSEENIDLLKSPINRSPKLKTLHNADSSPTITVDTQQGDILPHANESVLRTAKINSHTTLLSPRAVPEKPMYLHLNDTQITDPTTPDKETRKLSSPIHNPVSDGLPPRVPTPDFRIHTPDLRSRTPDYKTPTSDISDGYGSTTSDEYYECSESPFHEIFDKVPFHSLEDQPKNETPNSPNSRRNCGSDSDLLSNEDRTMSSSETLNLSVKGSLSSILERLGEEEKATNDKIVKEVEEKKIEQDVTEASEEVKEKADVNLEKTLNELPVDKKDNQPQATESNKVLNQATVVDLSLTLCNEATEAKRMSVRELKPKKVYPKPERPDRMPAGVEKTDRAALSPASVDRPQATREPGGQKQQQKDFGVVSNSRLAHPTRPPRPLSATQATLVRQGPSRTDRKMSDGDIQVLESTTSSRRLPPRPPPPASASKLLSPNQHFRLTPTSPVKTKQGQMQNSSPLPKPQPSFLYTHTQTQNPCISAQAVAIQEGPGQDEEKTAFGITFSKLYNLKGLKDKMSKLPTQNRKGSTSSSAQPRKSTG